MSEPEKSSWWKEVDWTGAVAFTLTLGVSLSLFAAMTAAAFAAMDGRTITDVAATMFSTIFGAAMGAIATFLGQSRERQLNKQDSDGPGTF